MCTKLPTPRDKLSLQLVTSPPRKKSKTTFGSPVNDSKEDEERTCLDESGGRGGEISMQQLCKGTLRKNLKPNLD